MSRKINLPGINNLVKRYRAGESIKNLASELGVSEHAIRRRFSEAGVAFHPSGRAAISRPPLEEMLALYNAGIGIGGIAKRLGAGRTYVREVFKKAGIEARNPHEQQLERMRRTSPEERQRLAKAAHDAVRGKKRGEEQFIKSAITRYQYNTFPPSVYEDALAKILRKRGIKFIQQYPVSRYNCDFIINGVAVEIFGGQWHFHGDHFARLEERTKKILGAGYSLVFVLATQQHKIDAAIADKIISETNILGGDKTSPRQYRVIWGTPDLVTGGGADDEKITIVYPLASRRDPATGRYKGVPRDAVGMHGQ